MPLVPKADSVLQILVLEIAIPRGQPRHSHALEITVMQQEAPYQDAQLKLDLKKETREVLQRRLIVRNKTSVFLHQKKQKQHLHELK